MPSYRKWKSDRHACFKILLGDGIEEKLKKLKSIKKLFSTAFLLLLTIFTNGNIAEQWEGKKIKTGKDWGICQI